LHDGFSSGRNQLCQILTQSRNMLICLHTQCQFAKTFQKLCTRRTLLNKTMLSRMQSTVIVKMIEYAVDDKESGRFATMTFRPQDVSPLAWTFHPQDVSYSRRFAPRTFRHLDISPPARSAFGCFAPCLDVSLLRWTFHPHSLVLAFWTSSRNSLITFGKYCCYAVYRLQYTDSS